MKDFVVVVTGLAQAPGWVCETVYVHTCCLFAVCVKALPGGSDGKESACSVRDPGLIPGSGRSPGEFLTGEFHGQRILMGYSPWGGVCEE